MNEFRTKLSVLDRLMDDRPRGLRMRTATVEELRESVGKHLRSLLNTRRPRNQGFEEHDSLRGTILNYGLPDFTAYSLDSDRAQDELALAIQSAIRAFEPRLTGVSVTAVPRDGSLTFRVRANLTVRPASERIQFHAVLETSSGRLLTGEIRSDE